MSEDEKRYQDCHFRSTRDVCGKEGSNSLIFKPFQKLNYDAILLECSILMKESK